MESAIVVRSAGSPAERPVSLSDISRIFFRHKRVFLVSFFIIAAAAAATAFLLPRKYESSVEILVQRGQTNNALAPL
jgi:uncharacterized protein involved in exopolysaccharide biosynthesis